MGEHAWCVAEHERLRAESKQWQQDFASLTLEHHALRDALRELVEAWHATSDPLTYRERWNAALERARAALKEVEHG